MSKELKTGFIVEEQVAGIGRWFRTNEWVYEDDLAAMGLAERRSLNPSVSKTRLLKIQHTEPKEVWSSES